LKQANERDTGLDIPQIDRLLTQLASLSSFSHSSIQRDPDLPNSRLEILKLLYSSLSSTEASFLTQIILKDLRPVLYPSNQTHYTAALKQQKSNSVIYLDVVDALKVWDPTLNTLSRWRVVSSFEVALSNDRDPMLVGNPLQVSKLPALLSSESDEFVVTWAPCALLDSKDRQGYRVRSSVETFPRLSTGLGRDQVRR